MKMAIDRDSFILGQKLTHFEMRFSQLVNELEYFEDSLPDNDGVYSDQLCNIDLLHQEYLRMVDSIVDEDDEESED